MANELMICVPGPWKKSGDFVAAVITAEPMGRFMFAGMILADLHAKEHISAEWDLRYTEMRRAFEIAGHGKLPEAVLAQVEAHQGAVYLRFPAPLSQQRKALLKFSRLLESIVGVAVKVESAGVAHTWQRWFELLESENPFDWYCAGVVLIADEDVYYSCGMHNFELADAQISSRMAATEAAEILNQFNYWRLSQTPYLEAGHTFSLSQDNPHFRLEETRDSRHEEDDPFFNPQGLWSLNPK